MTSAHWAIIAIVCSALTVGVLGSAIRDAHIRITRLETLEATENWCRP